MRGAIALAKTTPPGDVPVAALVYSPGGDIIGRGVNRREADGDPTAHAELVALRQAARTLGGWRLDGCEIVVTLEPCTMCAGAILGARCRSLVFGAFEPNTGAVGSLFDALRDPHHLHTVEVRGGVLQAEASQLLSEFFTQLR